MKKFSTLLLLTFTMLNSLFAQSTTGVEMATGLRSSGKIYVVVLVIAVLFIGLMIYLASIDRKVSKLEKNKK
jgi:hypothetical protein